MSSTTTELLNVAYVSYGRLPPSPRQQQPSRSLLNNTYSNLRREMWGYLCILVLLIFLTRMITAEDDSSTSLSPYVSLNHRVNMPRLGLGTAGLRQSTSDVVYAAINSGLYLIDTAQAREWYSEELVGQGLEMFLANEQNKKETNGNYKPLELEDITIVTKVHPRSFDFDKMKAKIIESSQLLKRNLPIDVVLLHSPNCWKGHCTPEEEAISWKVGWNNLESMQSMGLVLNIGVSNFDIDILRELESSANVKVSVVQNWMDPFHQDTEVRRYCADNDITYMAYSSFGTQWEWKLEHNPVFLNPVLDRIATKHSCSIAKVVLSWLLQEGVVAIPRSSSSEHITDNASLLDINTDTMKVRGVNTFLDDTDMLDVRNLDGILGSLWD